MNPSVAMRQLPYKQGSKDRTLAERANGRLRLQGNGRRDAYWIWDGIPPIG